MKKYLVVILSLALLVPLSISKSTDTGLDEIMLSWRQSVEAHRYADVIEAASKMYREASLSADMEERLCAEVHLAQAYSGSGQYDSAYLYLEKAASDIVPSSRDYLKVLYYNVKAIMSVSVEMDYASALDSFDKALDVIRYGSGDKMTKERERLILCNMANLYGMRNDTLGLEYASEAYGLSKEANDIYVLSSSVMTLVHMMVLREDYDKALEYIEELRDISVSVGSDNCLHMVYVLTAEVYSKMGRDAEVEENYEKALAMSDMVGDKTAVVSAHLNYGDVLRRQGRNGEALEIYDRGLNLAMENEISSSLDGLYLGLSEVYASLGDKDRSHEYYGQYSAMERQKIANERKFGYLQIRNERLLREKEISEKELSLAKARQRIMAGTAATVILLIVSVAVYVLYVRKKKMYALLAESYYDLSEAMAKLSNAAEKKTVPQKHGDDSLFPRIESLMKDDKLYRKKDVSLDMIADALGSNRSYVSKEINAGSGLSFYGYINGYRISEAESILRESGNDIPLKALCEELGFNSMSVFYRSFQEKTGIPPARYREEMRRLKAMRDHS